MLEVLGLGMGDLIKMRVFPMKDAHAPMDFKGLMEG
jgi:hypothetical protein